MEDSLRSFRSAQHSARRGISKCRKPVEKVRFGVEMLERRLLMATFAVTTTSDGGAGSLRAAIMSANASPGADTITLPAGTYTMGVAGVDEDANVTGDFDITEGVTIQGDSATTTIIDANGLDRAFHVIGAIPVTLSGIAIVNGLASAGGTTGNFGGAILNGGTLALSGVRVTDNHASYGGAVYSIGASVSVDASVLLGNAATVDGGAIHIDVGTLTITGSQFTSNAAVHAGGAIRNIDADSITIDGSVLSQNNAGADGGAIDSTSAEISITGSTMNDNTVGSNGSGGGAIRSGDNLLSLISSTFSRNHSGDLGGAVYRTGGDLVVEDCNFDANDTVRSGGAIFHASGEVRISGSTFTNNHAAGTGGDGGGAIFDGNANVTLTGCTIQDNSTSGIGGGVMFANNEVSTIVDCVISDNISADAGGGVALHAFGGGTSGALTITNSTLSGNDAGVSGVGGGVSSDDGPITVTGSTLTNNQAADGGAIWSDGGLAVDASVIIGNNATNDGGGITVGAGTLTIIGSQLTSNSAAHWGGAIRNTGADFITVDNSIVSQNHADWIGGAIDSAGSTIAITDSTMNDNDAVRNGGAMRCSGDDLVTLTRSTFNRNRSGDSGGVIEHFSGDLIVDDCDFDGNFAFRRGGAIEHAGASLTVSGSTFTNNHAGGYDSGGGAIFDGGSTFTMSDSSIHDNTTGGDGAGINIVNSYVVTITRTTISNNTSVRNAGGIWHQGAMLIGTSTLTITDSTLSGNRAGTSYSGGGIYSDAGIVTVTGSNLTNNRAAEGGAILSKAILEVADSVFNGNSATGGNGGAIYMDNPIGKLTVSHSDVSGNGAHASGGAINSAGITFIDGTTIIGNIAGTLGAGSAGAGAGISALGPGLSITDSDISDNAATGRGGGVLASNLTMRRSTVAGNSTPVEGAGIFLEGLGSTSSITDTTVSDNFNTGREGGGIYNLEGDLTLSNSTISHNKGELGGGGIFNRPSAGTPNTVTLLNCTVTSNLSLGGDGGGLVTEAPGIIRIKNTIVAANNGVSAPDAAGEITSDGFNLIGNTTGITLLGDSTGNVTNVNPLLGPLADNGGLTRTHLPLPGSPAIDAATPAGAPAADQRGVARPLLGGFDIGAIESQTNTRPVPPAGAPTIGFDVAQFTTDEGVAEAAIVLTRGGDVSSAATVDFSTTLSGTATPGLDYTSVTQAVSFGAGQANQTMLIPILDDSLLEATETVTLALSNFSTGVSAGTNPMATLSIVDDERAPRIVTGTLKDGRSRIQLFDGLTNERLLDFRPFSENDINVRVALGDVTGDGTPDIIAALSDDKSRVRVFDGNTGERLDGPLGNLTPFAFGGGAYVAAADLNRDGRAEVIVGSDKKRHAEVNVYDGATGALLAGPLGTFNAFAATKNVYGVSVAMGDVDGDGTTDFVLGTAHGGSLVNVVSGVDATLLKSLVTYDASFNKGVYVAAADFTGAGRAQILTAPRERGNGVARFFIDGLFQREFTPAGADFRDGFTVSAANVSGDGLEDVIVGIGRRNGNHVAIFCGTDLAELSGFRVLSDHFSNPVYVAAN